MEDFSLINKGKNDIIFFKKINAGKRIYYIDVKKNKKDEFFLAITESKKVFSGEKSEDVVFEKHKLFLYKEDFDKFVNALNESLEYIKEQNENNVAFSEESDIESEKIRLNFDF